MLVQMSSWISPTTSSTVPPPSGTAVSLARTADDFFWVGGKATIWSITVAMIVMFPNAPSAFELEIHFGNQPSNPIIHQSDSFEVTDLGMWNGDPELHLFSVRFDTGGLQLTKGRNWVVPYAIGNGSGTDRAWWGTAGNGQVNGSEGYFRSDHFGVPQWTPISQSGILNFPTDFAFTIDATFPAPGVLPLLVLGLLGKNRRRVETRFHRASQRA